MWLFRDRPKTAGTIPAPAVRRTEITLEREIVSILTASPSGSSVAAACPTCGYPLLDHLAGTHTYRASALAGSAPTLPMAPADPRGDL